MRVHQAFSRLTTFPLVPRVPKNVVDPVPKLATFGKIAQHPLVGMVAEPERLKRELSPWIGIGEIRLYLLDGSFMADELRSTHQSCKSLCC